MFVFINCDVSCFLRSRLQSSLLPHSLPEASIKVDLAMGEPEFVIPIRGISWIPGKSAWQVYSRKKYVGIFPLGELEGQAAKKAWLQAVAAKAAASGVSKAELLRAGKRSHQQSQQSEQSRQSQQSEQSKRFKGVTVQYMAQNPTTAEYIGTFATPLEAARAVADEVGVDVNTLKRKASELVNVGDQMQRFKALVNIYTDEDGTAQVMSDITASVEVCERRKGNHWVFPHPPTHLALPPPNTSGCPFSPLRPSDLSLC